MLHVIAGASPDNTPAGYYWTFLFPEILFIVSALILWALFGRPHHRVPAGRIRLGLGTTARATGAAATAAGPAVASSAADEANGEQPSADGAGAGE